MTAAARSAPADLPVRVSGGDLRPEPLEVPAFLERRLELLGVDRQRIVDGLLRGDLLEVPGLGPGTLRRLLALYTTLPVTVPPGPGGPRASSGPAGFGPGKVSRKVALSGELRRWCVLEAELRGIPRPELVRRCVSLLHALVEREPRIARTVHVPSAQTGAGEPERLHLRVLWPRHLWLLVTDLLGSIDTNVAGIARAALHYAMDNPQLAELVDVQPERTPDALHELLNPPGPF